MFYFSSTRKVIEDASTGRRVFTCTGTPLTPAEWVLFPFRESQVGLIIVRGLGIIPRNATSQILELAFFQGAYIHTGSLLVLMDFLKSAVVSAISKGPAFGYSFGDRVDIDDALWTLHNGTKRVCAPLRVRAILWLSI